jgi:cytosine/adenosine deaminase-related metal-dependent hydrolase
MKSRISPITIINASILLGKELDYTEHGYIEIENGIIKSAGPGDYNGAIKKLDARDFLIIPGFINAHTHIADSIGKDIAAGYKLDARIHPVFGAKRKILEKSKPEHLKSFIRGSAISMMKKGIVTFADFREGGPEGIRLLREAIADLPIKCVAFGRVDHYNNPKEASGLPPDMIEKAKQVLLLADGLGISGANENTDVTLAQYKQLAEKKLLAIHAAESRETVEFSKLHTGRSEVDRITEHLRPDFIVHMTNATEDEIQQVARSNIGIVICPRANGVLGAGIPQIARMLRHGCTVAIGTDNVMLNSPDILRELDYIWKASRAIEGEMIEARTVLKMATVNAAQILRLNSGCIESGRSADLIFINKKHIDLYPIHDPYASVVHRLSQSSIGATMIDGQFVEEIN